MSDRNLENSGLAKGLISIAEKRLVHNYPFHARLVSMWRVTETYTMPTVGVTIRNGAVHLVYNPNFIVTCTVSELQGVLLHEINHVIFDLLLASPTMFPDRRARVIAEEVTVNEWIAEPLPGTPITLAQYPELPANEDTNTRYARLARTTGSSVPKSARGAPKEPGSVPKNTVRVPKTGPIGPEMPQPLDNHDLWEEARRDEGLAKLIIKVTLAAAGDAMTKEEWDKVRAELRLQIARLSRGNEPRKSLESLAPVVTGVIPWQQILRRYVRRALDSQPVFQRPPRRFPHLVGIVPGVFHRPGKARVMAVIDTSGSIGKAAIEQISAELALMNRKHDVTVIECDAAIHAVYKFINRPTTVKGRGGTDLRPPFQPAVVGKLNPDVIVYFTDGAGPAPIKRPRIPVIWCLTIDGERPAPWGRVIYMDGRVHTSLP